MAARGWMMEIHRIAGWGLIALIAWKTVIAARSLRRGFDRRISRSVIYWGLADAGNPYPARASLQPHVDLACCGSTRRPSPSIGFWRWLCWHHWSFTSGDGGPARKQATLHRAGATALAGWWIAETFAQARLGESPATVHEFARKGALHREPVSNYWRAGARR